MSDWTWSIGTSLIKSVEVSIGNQIVDRIPNFAGYIEFYESLKIVCTIYYGRFRPEINLRLFAKYCLNTNTLALCSYNEPVSRIVVWDYLQKTFRYIQISDDPNFKIQNWVVSPCSRFILIKPVNQRLIQIWSLETGKLLREIHIKTKANTYETISTIVWSNRVDSILFLKSINYDSIIWSKPGADKFLYYHYELVTCYDINNNVFTTDPPSDYRKEIMFRPLNAKIVTKGDDILLIKDIFKYQMTQHLSKIIVYDMATGKCLPEELFGIISRHLIGY